VSLGTATVSRLSAFAYFWYDFIVGDDWRVAAGVVAALAATFALRNAGGPLWLLMPLPVVVLLPFSLWRAVRRAAYG